jgi:hypothetical protein
MDHAVSVGSLSLRLKRCYNGLSNSLKPQKNLRLRRAGRTYFFRYRLQVLFVYRWMGPRPTRQALRATPTKHCSRCALRAKRVFTTRSATRHTCCPSPPLRRKRAPTPQEKLRGMSVAACSRHRLMCDVRSSGHRGRILICVVCCVFGLAHCRVFWDVFASSCSIV